MSLLSADITKVKRLSLIGASLPVPEQKEPEEQPYTEEERRYSLLVDRNPVIEELVESLDLVSLKTRDRLRRKPQEKPLSSSQLTEVAQRALQGGRTYTRAEITEALQQVNQITRNRAERGFTLLLEAGIITATLSSDSFYLASSTPF